MREREFPFRNSHMSGVYRLFSEDSTSRFCCHRAPSSSVQDEIEKLEGILEALEMRIKGIAYERQELFLKAKRAHAEHNELMALGFMKIRHEKEGMHKRFVNVYTNVSQLRDSLDDTSTFSDVVHQMGLANKMLEEALKRVNPEQIDALMDDLGENQMMAKEVGDALGRERGEDFTFDEDKALRELSPKTFVEIVPPPIINSSNVRVPLLESP